ASISTEARVVNKLREEGKTKEDLGREAFLEETWDWTYKYGGTIRNQLKKLGVSCDWERERFTLDEELSEAVEEVFIRLYDKGLIYRGRSEEHTSELQSRFDLVCRLLLENKK